MPRIAHKYAIVALDAVTMLFWFAGFIALAVFVTELSLCFGNVCHTAQAAIVFGAFTWYACLRPSCSPGFMKVHALVQRAVLLILVSQAPLRSDDRPRSHPRLANPPKLGSSACAEHGGAGTRDRHGIAQEASCDKVKDQLSKAVF